VSLLADLALDLLISSPCVTSGISPSVAKIRDLYIYTRRHRLQPPIDVQKKSTRADLELPRWNMLPLRLIP
jgi:hypothetical protein